MNALVKLPREQINLQFFEFTHYQQLNRNLAWHDGLIECYREVFQESWGENYSYQEVKQRLQKELTGSACLRFVMDMTTNKVIGFCWAQFLSPSEIKCAIASIKYIHTVKHFLIDDAVQTTSSIIYIHDIGILKSARNQVPLSLLILPVLESVALYSHCRQIMFWSIQQTCIAHLASKIDIRPYYKMGDVQFFNGVLPAVYGIK